MNGEEKNVAENLWTSCELHCNYIPWYQWYPLLAGHRPSAVSNSRNTHDLRIASACFLLLHPLFSSDLSFDLQQEPLGKGPNCLGFLTTKLTLLKPSCDRSHQTGCLNCTSRVLCMQDAAEWTWHKHFDTLKLSKMAMMDSLSALIKSPWSWWQWWV